MSKKLLLIQSVGEKKHIGSNNEFALPPLGLGVVAALTPAEWDIEIVDEAIAPLHEEYFNTSWDLVGISTTTLFVNRAYHIGQKFRSLGAPVVFGGVHPSIFPDEPLVNKAADSVVVGEAESTWPLLIRDFELNRLKSQYAPLNIIESNLVTPRRDLFDDAYSMDGLYATRGCPFYCDFCSVHAVHGNVYKIRPVDDILDEWMGINKDFIFVVDDNLFGDSENNYSAGIELCKKKIQRGIDGLWLVQVPVAVSSSKSTIRALSEANCKVVIIGFESLSSEVLLSMRKSCNLEFARRFFSGDIENCYRRAIDAFHEFGIAVIGNFIFGYDNEPEKIVNSTNKFILSSELDGYSYFTLQPFPGTPCYNRLQSEGRLIHSDYPKDWAFYGGKKFLIKSKRINNEFYKKMEEGIINLSESMLTQEYLSKTTAVSNAKIANFCYAWNKANYNGIKFLFE